MRNTGTVWIKFARTIVKICFALIIAAGAGAGIALWVNTNSASGLFSFLLLTGLGVLLAFGVCSIAFIKLDMAEDVHAIRKKLLGERDDEVVKLDVKKSLSERAKEGEKAFQAARKKLNGFGDPGNNKW